MVHSRLLAGTDFSGPKTLHVPSGEVLDVFDAAEEYIKGGHQLVILAGKDYGCGSSRDWAAKGPFLQVSQRTIYSQDVTLEY